MKYLFLRLLLMPFGIFYILAVAIRNWLYDRKILKSIEFEVPVISVGNLRVGGSGKSPMVEYLVRLLCTNHKVCILSRGYKRNSSGFRMASSVDTPESLGDESFQFYRKFGSRAGVAVGEDRMMAIPEILALTGEPAVIILDDAFQHRQVKPALNILLTSWQYLFYKDHIMPYGMLREPGKNAARADCVVVTKCPADITSRAMDQTREKLACYAPAKEIFFSTIEYGEPVAFSGNRQKISRNLVLVTGIADPSPLEEYVKKNFTLCRHLRYEDHHDYTIHDARMIRNVSRTAGLDDVSMLVTEKDMVKLSADRFKSMFDNLPMFYIPIVFKFVEDGRKFDGRILTMIEKFNLNS